MIYLHILIHIEIKHWKKGLSDNQMTLINIIGATVHSRKNFPTCLFLLKFPEQEYI